ncbi:hypothetical protein ACH3VR_12790 [Microbacterium sp. B2969]|uniref:Lipoprotein n=1 Tax=Microbacterium alkaliflavum TaxID=3248839 RepID=A0ABW7Q8P0_9MICO
MHRGLLSAAALCGVLVLAACTAPVGDPDLDPRLAVISAEFVQLRSDVAARQAEVRVTNDGDVPVQVGDVEVRDDRFDGVATRVNAGRVSTIPAGGTVDIRVQLPAMDCDVSEGQTSVWLEVPSFGEGMAFGRPLPDELSVIAPLHERECRAAAVAAAADVSLSSFTPSPAGEPADLTLTVVPTGEASASLVAMHATNLLTFAGDDVETYPLDLAIAEGDSDTVEVHVPIEPLRCDPHAVQEDKRGTVFTLDVEVDGAPGQIELAASEDMRGAILTWVGQWCGFGS